ncbi:MAG: chemoreceptor glutamine deamidase CheD [Nitrosomonas sp.]|uniref:chemoreceptor glutamine deamidase CheD n=1 Tax=Nitrosomonas sp. TaxID=42353 RepID=UPI001A4AD96A|nr:chemoreceptor glutamine deamidase CheD [Nitrosomonas sp.]MBL8500592.1 chemoreceptor glutamine deamidase CheD [Nitrosomonas sp.]MCG7757421.1 chemoreceptor glutamine deamidase CheD [Nitrosomonas sp.]UJP00047.1 MAG: chemoreceptor glutamine deamidase CheD [Nitrosomonas sp.]UJP02864.1 MAG: chemoreceptor glutamine deamidase CheD [Nitrosomonas sp.]UJP07188.1 MAG: chemoreceptor glutamine deamidase CheD [Nitrosomonas sp.]
MAEIIDDQVATNLYFDKSFNSQAVKLLPGEYYVTDKDLLLVTVLGSCVAACIRDSYSGIGGMNHFMLPDGGGDAGSPLNASARYGTYAMEILINQLLKLGARRGNLEAKVFGGGNVLDGLTVANVGQRNADFVLKFLQTEKIKVVAQDLVDIFPRKVYFFPKSSKVMVKKLRNIHNTTISQREKDYRQRLHKVDSGGDVELFS